MLLTCAVCFVTYSVAALIVHKLDMIDMNRVGVIPFCGKNGMYKYEILVKTGWGRGSGEPTACSLPGSQGAPGSSPEVPPSARHTLNAPRRAQS